MSATVKKALDSKDPKVLKSQRSQEKGRVTRCVNQILEILKLDESNSYDHKSIDKIELEQAEINLKEAFNNVRDLHDEYQWYRDEGTDASKEEEIVNEQIEYFVTVETKYNEAQKSILKYKHTQKGERNILQRNILQFINELERFHRVFHSSWRSQLYSPSSRFLE